MGASFGLRSGCPETRQLAHHRLRNEPDGSLNTTALVHEAYLKLLGSPHPNLRDRSPYDHLLPPASKANLIEDSLP